MEKRIIPFVWRNSRADQIKGLVIIAISLPVLYASLPIPKIIVNDALGAKEDGMQFPTQIVGLEFSQIQFLVLMSLLFILFVLLNNWIKNILNTQLGRTGERMLRRVRYQLYEQVMRFRIRRFRGMQQGEIVQSIMGEVEPLGGFFAEVITTPIFQGGMLMVYMTFIFLQDPFLGVAAIALYPFQAWLVPKLQKRVVVLNKQRVGNVRKVADSIGSSVSAIPEIHVNDTARWHLAQVSNRLYENTKIRIEIFKRKYLIKSLNNVIIALTPFAFYLFGGIQVIKGELDIGSLVAVLAAYKEVANPWKALLTYFQRFSDLSSRFTLVIENFDGEDVAGADRIFGADGAAPAPLRGDLEVRGVETAGGGGLKSASCRAPEGALVAVRGGENGAREQLLRFMGGLDEPDRGRVAVGGADLLEQTMPTIGVTLGYAGAAPIFFAGTLRENITYSLRRITPPLAGSGAENAEDRAVEARITGNIDAAAEGDWIDYAAAGATDKDSLDDRLIEIAGHVGLTDELYSSGLAARFNPRKKRDLAEGLIATRALIRDRIADEPKIADIVHFWETDRFNPAASLLENVLYALPIDGAERMGDYVDNAHVRDLLRAIGAEETLVAIGWDIVDEFAELLGAVDESSAILDGFAAYPKSDILATVELSTKRKLGNTDKIGEDERRTLLSFALEYTQTRDRLDVLDEADIAALMALRDKARARTGDDPAFIDFAAERYGPAVSLSENLLNGKRRHDRRNAWRQVDDFIERAIQETGLYSGVVRLGLGIRLGAGGAGLSAASKRRAALMRALVKGPKILISDGVAGGADEGEMRAAIRTAAPEATIVFAIAEDADLSPFDHVITITEDGGVSEGPPRA